MRDTERRCNAELRLPARPVAAAAGRGRLMPIGLPLPTMPQQGEVELLRASGLPSASMMIGDVRLQLYAPGLPIPPDLGAALQTAGTLSDAVYRIRDAYYASGYPAVRLLYATVGDELLVGVMPGTLSELEMPQRYRAYFAPLVGTAMLTDARLEPPRILASLHADRAGDSGQLALQTTDQETQLVLNPDHDGHRVATLTAGLGNPGNRFLGRYFADVGASIGYASGDEASLALRQALPWAQDEADARYREARLAWNRVTPSGIWGAGGYYAGYRLRVSMSSGGQRIRLDGDIAQAELNWQQLLAADFAKRWTLGARLDYTDKKLDAADGGARLQHQEYPSLEASTALSLQWPWRDRAWSLDAALSVQQGLGRDETAQPITAADLSYTLLRPAATLSAGVGKGSEFSIRASAQIAGARLPEQRQWVVGGPDNLEAFLPGVIVGDSGALLRLQFDLAPIVSGGLRWMPGVFVEAAAARFEHVPAAASAGTQSLADAGIALKASWRERVDARLSYARPLMHDGVERAVREPSGAPVFFTLAVSL